MANNMISKDLGPATAYAIAVENGYTGTEEQWASEIANASNNVQIASQKASDAEAYAAGTRGGEAVDSDDPAYQNNAEYYSGEAADSAEAAAGSATSAAESAATASAAYNVNLLAPNYSSSNTYAVGDHVIYDGGYYECISAISTAEAWTAAHWRQVTVGAEAADLKSAFDLLAYSDVNLFDKTTATVGKVLSDGVETTSVNGFYSDYIPITAGVFLVPKGTSTGGSYIQLYNSSKTYVGSAPPTDLGNGLLKYTINSAIVAYIRFNNDKRQIDSVMFVRGESYPDEYVPYQSAILKKDIPLSVAQKKYVDDSIADIADDLPNMFDKTSSGIINGYFSNSTFTENDNYRMTHPIYVENGKTYKYPHSPNLGANYAIAKLDNNFNFTGGLIAGTIADGIVTFTSDADTFVRLNIGTVKYLNAFFCVKAEDYIGKYVPYGKQLDGQTFPNINFNTPNLFNKRVVFDGDSICYGAGDSVGGNAYASRIGNANEMIWANVGVSGGTIAVVSGYHNLCTYIDTIHTNYPELDYLILEGGTNDADHLQMEGIGTLSEYDDFSGSYDTSTFYGALETLFYKATQYYPSAKIGFIIAPKMSIWVESQGRMVLPTRRINYFEAAAETCKKWGIPYIDLWNGCAMNSCLEAYYDHTMTAEQNLAAGKMYADQQHPNANGYDYIWSIIANWMNTL